MSKDDVAVLYNKDGQGFRYPTTIPRSELDPAWVEKVRNARMAISMATPLIAFQMYQCHFEFTEELPFPTAAALVSPDKNIIYFHPKLVREASPRKMAFVVLHETLHIFLEHQTRGVEMGYDPMLWNIAADYYINPVCLGYYRDENGNICRHEAYEKYVEIDPSWKFEEKFIGMSADEIYWYILKDCNNNKEEARKKYCGDGQSGDLMPGPGKAGEGEGEGEGNIFSPGEGTGDKMFDWVPDAQASRSQIQKNRRTSATAIARAQKQGTGIGAHEAGMVRYMEDLFRPKVHWTDHIHHLARAAVKDRSTYNRVSRRSQGEIILPSKHGEKLVATFGVDTSGSMSDAELSEAASEFHGVMDQFLSWEAELVSCDVKAHLIDRFASGNGDTFTASDVKLKGGGGTDMSPIVAYNNERIERGEEVNVCIIVTDGYVPNITEPMDGDCQYIFVVNSGGNRDFNPPGATVLYMDEVA